MSTPTKVIIGVVVALVVVAVILFILVAGHIHSSGSLPASIPMG